MLSESDKINKNVDSKTSEISTKLDDALSRISNLEEKVDDALDRITVLENVLQADKTEEQELIYHGVHERITREKNVIVFGVPESDEEDFLDNFITDLFTGKDILFDMNSFKYHRFGRTIEGKTRPVKIVFCNADYAKWVLLNKSKFSGAKVKLVNDKTPEQLNYLSNLGSQLDELKKSGIKHYTIKYIRNIPRIVDTRTSSKPIDSGSKFASKTTAISTAKNGYGSQLEDVSMSKPNDSRSRTNSGSSSNNSQYSTKEHASQRQVEN
ncbi:hypothetical protein QAD02_008332 [Eretmocerus hayati]|uniref:Uncharacterized protein n=1 Tax=Eretmocerus hayati TaxID=131215 RepID=A0ACC2N645_9HYME|nr:hypothetical protein QAD02_008332 [Eretmocerus hayati]